MIDILAQCQGTKKGKERGLAQGRGTESILAQNRGTEIRDIHAQNPEIERRKIEIAQGRHL